MTRKYDFRKYFNRYVTKKPRHWHLANVIRELTDLQKVALQKLPHVAIMPDWTTFDDMFDASDGNVEMVVCRVGVTPSNNEYYYVNTEGYSYARYVAAIPNIWD